MSWTYHNKPPLGWPLDFGKSINKDIISFWPMNEGSGKTVNDLCKIQNTGTFEADTHFVPGRSGSGVYLDGTADYISTAKEGQYDSFKALTLLVWVYWTESPPGVGAHEFISKREAWSGTGIPFDFNYNENASWRWTFIIKGTGNILKYTSVVASSKVWYQAVAVWDGVNQFIYLNGIKVAQQACVVDITDNNINVALGSRADAISSTHLGIFDHIAIWRRALSPFEVALLYRFPWQGFKNPDEIPILDQYYSVTPEATMAAHYYRHLMQGVV